MPFLRSLGNMMRHDKFLDNRVLSLFLLLALLIEFRSQIRALSGFIFGSNARCSNERLET